MKHYITAAALAAACLGSAHAASINGLYNTGTGTSGNTDPYYTLTSSSVTETVPTITGPGFPVGTWLDNNAVSKWITPTAAQGQSLDPASDGIYTYTLTFDLTGYNAASALFSGRVAADNSVEVLLNNNSIGSWGYFTSWGGFNANSGFVAGVNTLEFVVTNQAQTSGNPTGLRVEFLDSSVNAVPEPSTYAMLLGGLALLGAVARRRHQQ